MVAWRVLSGIAYWAAGRLFGPDVAGSSPTGRAIPSGMVALLYKYEFELCSNGRAALHQSR